MLNARMTLILREVMKAATPVTSEYLAKVIDVTSRTIRNDMKELETIVSTYGGLIKCIRGTGYQLEIHDDNAFRQLLLKVADQDKEKLGEMPNIPEERVYYILKRMLLADDYLKLENIADELYISKSTLQNDLRDVKKILKQYGITLDKKPNFGLMIDGDEFKLRLCMVDHIFNKIKNDLDLEQTGIDIFSTEDINNIRNIILEQVRIHAISLSDIGLHNLVIHIAIAINRIQNEKYVTLYPKELSELKKQRQYSVAMEIVAELEKSQGVIFPETETAYITIHLLGTRMITELNFTDSDLQEIIDNQIFTIVNKILETVDRELNLRIKDDKELHVAMSLHLNPAINRYRYGIHLPNPLIDDIKAKYPGAFQAAIIAGMVLKQELEIEINENEIGYLALHLGAAMESVRTENHPKKCMIICASGLGSARLLARKLQSRFGSRIEIVGTTEYYKVNQIPLMSLDFLVSTIPISIHLPIPVIQVNTILGGNDLDKIERVLLERDNHTIQYLREELVFLQRDFETRDEVLNFIGKQLESLGLVQKDFLKAVYERETISPTSFGNFVAIPHPVMPQTETTFWAVCTLKKPIDWGGKRVQFVCLLNVEKNSTDELQNMYDLLVKIIDNTHAVQQLIKCKTYNEFITIFKNQS